MIRRQRGSIQIMIRQKRSARPIHASSAIRFQVTRYRSTGLVRWRRSICSMWATRFTPNSGRRAGDLCLRQPELPQLRRQFALPVDRSGVSSWITTFRRRHKISGLYNYGLSEVRPGCRRLPASARPGQRFPLYQAGQPRLADKLHLDDNPNAGQLPLWGDQLVETVQLHSKHRWRLEEPWNLPSRSIQLRRESAAGRVSSDGYYHVGWFGGDGSENPILHDW
jgi:hypothetical protein